MTKSELKTGMVVTMRSGKKYRVYRNVATNWTDYNSKEDGVFVRNSQSWDKFEYYNNDLTSKMNKNGDIMKVELVRHPYDFIKDVMDVDIIETLWERKEAKEMTVAEISKLLGYEVKIVK